MTNYCGVARYPLSRCVQFEACANCQVPSVCTATAIMCGCCVLYGPQDLHSVPAALRSTVTYVFGHNHTSPTYIELCLSIGFCAFCEQLCCIVSHQLAQSARASRPRHKLVNQSLACNQGSNMSSSSFHDAVSSAQVRERLPQNPEQPQQVASTEEARKAVRQLNDQEASKNDKDKRTYGRTPDGTGAFPDQTACRGIKLADFLENKPRIFLVRLLYHSVSRALAARTAWYGMANISLQSLWSPRLMTWCHSSSPQRNQRMLPILSSSPCLPGMSAYSTCYRNGLASLSSPLSISSGVLATMLV